MEKDLHLVLRHKWFDMIKSGDKLEEYRDLTDYYRKKIDGSHTNVVFHKGYTNEIIRKKILSVSIGEGYEAWGAEKGKRYFCIRFGQKDSR